jgi:ketosteroid isomerase-like protein
MLIARRIAVGVSLAATLMLLLSTVGCSPQKAVESEASIIAALKSKSDSWDQAIIRKDLKAIADNMAEDFRHIGMSGEISDRDLFLKEIVSPELTINPYTVEDFDIRVYGDCALLCGRTKMTGTYKGKPFESHYRYIDTYRRIGGEWKVCSVQTTGVRE